MSAYPQGKTRVVIASADEDMAFALTQCLSKHDYAVRLAPTRPIAMEMIREHHPQIILLDHSWNHALSPALLRKLKQLAREGEPFIVWIGDSTSLKTKPGVILDGFFDDFIRYPADERELRARLNVLARHQETTRRLRATEERYRSLFDRSLDAVYVHDLQGNFLDANPAALKLFGYTREEIPAISLESLTQNEAELKRARESIKRVLEKGFQEEPEEYQLRKRDGSLIWVECMGSPILERGHPAAIQGIARDITERKQAAIKLAESERRFRTIFENAAIGLAIVHPKTKRILQCNAALGEMFGYSVKELCRMTVADVSHPEDHKRDLEFGAEMYEGRRDRFIMEKRYRRKGGDWMWGKLTATVVPNDKGEAQFVIGMVEDITERKRAQDALEKNARSLATLMSNLPGMAYRVRNDRKWTAEFVSEGALELTGYSQESFLFGPERITLIDLIHPDDRDRIWEEVQLAIRENKPFEIVYRLKTASAAERWIWEKGRKVSGAGNQHEVIEGFLTDITYQKTLEQNFRRAQRMESIGSLAGGIAHDLNNLLLPIIMGLDMLEMSDPPPANRTTIESMRLSAQRGADLVKQILSFARGVDGAKASVDLNQLTSDLDSIIRHTFPKNIVFERDVIDNLPPVPADPTQLYQVLLNLCLNARDAMPSGGRLGLSIRQVHIDQQVAAMEPGAAPGPHVVVEVADEGEGISQDTIDRIFEPFFTTKKHGKGTGLGLSTSLEIIRNHNGFVKVYSEPGAGSCFKVFLPAKPENASRVTESPLLAEMPRGRGESILLVDDEASILNITKQTLETWGYRVITAENGAQALGRFTEDPPKNIDLVFTDLMMPDMDGVTLIDRLRQLKPNLHVMATSGMNAPENALRAAKMRVSHFIPKPYSTQTLLRLLRKTLESMPGNES